MPSQESKLEHLIKYLFFCLILLLLLHRLAVNNSLRTADAFPFVASLPPKNSYFAVTATYISAGSIYLSSLHKSKNLLNVSRNLSSKLKSALSFRRGFATNPWNTSSLQLKLYDIWWYNYLFFALVEHVWPCRAWSQGFFLKRVVMRGVNHTGYLEDTLTVFRGKHSSNSCCFVGQIVNKMEAIKIKLVWSRGNRLLSLGICQGFPWSQRNTPARPPRPPPPQKISFPPNHPRGKIYQHLYFPYYWTLK